MRKSTLLIAVAAVVVIAAGMTAWAQEHTYVGAEKCKMCHKAEFTSWAETTHAKATEHAKASTTRTFGPDCLKCHATNSNEALAGVQCEACHGAGSDYKQMSIMKDEAQAVANGLVIPSQATCDKCHTGEDHAAKKSLEENKGNVAAIHAKKAH